jgi:hypothetical protein
MNFFDEVAYMAKGRTKTDLSFAIAKAKKYQFLRIVTPVNVVLIFDVSTCLLWNAFGAAISLANRPGADFFSVFSYPAIIGNWSLPSSVELLVLSKKSSCPYRKGGENRLLEKDLWWTKSGRLELTLEATTRSSSGTANVLLLNRAFVNNLDDFFVYASEENWTVSDAGQTNGYILMQGSIVKSEHQTAQASNTSQAKNMGGKDLVKKYHDADARRANLPILTTSQFSDPNKGLWEFWDMDEATLQTQEVRARNPVLDLRDCNVAIDFGTSSTVVALDDNGVHKLLRIGVADFLEAVKTSHYENPTVLEFVDIDAMLRPWRTEAYLPNVQWGDVRCSHEALHNFRNNETRPEIVASILTKIKQWALRDDSKARVRVTGQEPHVEHELVPLTLRQPVKGRPLTVCAKDPFDPVELYAWFLGLTINWRGRGLFLRYYMTFPVAYENEVKEKILASFRRGLQRSFPAKLVAQPEFERFLVEERASEPAAYAAAAMPTLGIEPTPEGVAYAVFDFGGGTTDFDFGHYRLPTDEQADDEGWERVFEHFGSGGDKFLGGENLLENLAYQTFCHNIEVCRNHAITFSKPLDAQDFPGSELFLEQSQAASTNSLMLMEKLRQFWETGQAINKTGVEKLDLVNRDGKPIACEFSTPYDDLQKFLQDRIEVGVRNFYSALKKAFSEQMPEQVQVLLAGNASHSKIVRELFGLPTDVTDLDVKQPTQKIDLPAKQRMQNFIVELFGDHAPVFKVHPPLRQDDKNMYRPTAKTGVALGLLRLCPGSSTLVLRHTARNSIGDAPFLHYVGRIRLGKFHAGLAHGAAYQEWIELGPARDRVFVLIHTQEPRAHLGEMKEGETGLHQHRLDFAGSSGVQKVFARPVKPHEIEICTAMSLEAAQSGSFESLKTLKLG